MRFDNFFKIFLVSMLGIIGFFLMQTFSTIKSLEKDIITIREKMSALEATKISRKEIRELISEYHETHPCSRFIVYEKQKKKKENEYEYE